MASFIIQYAPEALEEIQHVINYCNSVSSKLGNRFKKNLF
jgi:hypothetical protein